jgi:hypothetical protein
MNTFDIDRPVTAHSLNENLYKQFNVRINFDKYTREELEDYRNLLRTKVNQLESGANFNELLTNENYQKDKYVLGVLNTRIKEMLGEAKKIAEKKLTAPETKKKEKIVKGMKKEKGDFEKRYGKRGKEVMYATATKLAKKTANEAQVNELSSELLDRASKKAHDQSLDLMYKTYDRGQTSQTRDNYGRVDRDVDPTKPLGKATIAKRNQADKFADASVKAARRDQERNDLKDLSPAMRKKLSRATEEVEEGTKMKKKPNDGNLANNAKPYGKVTRGDVVAGRLGKDAMGGKNKKESGKDGMSAKQAKFFGKKKVKENRLLEDSKVIIEAVVYYLREDEEGKAKAITSGVDMVNDFTSWMQRVANYQTKTMIELSDSIRANFGVQEAETFKTSVGSALETALNALTTTREEINNAVAVLAGEAPAAEPMGQEPEMDGMGDEEMGMSEPDELNMPDDEFAASDAAAGGPETLGRMKRESIDRGNRLMKILGA